jgi:MFS family permease
MLKKRGMSGIILEKKELPKGIRVLTWSTSIRWFGWGLGEAFIPIFLLLFSANLLETGILISIYYITFFLFLPVSGFLADNAKAKKMILASMLVYIFIGLGYFIAGVTGAVIFVIIVMGLNGISYSLDQVGRESYFIRHSPKKKVSSIFGHFDFITNFWWIVAVLVGFALVEYAKVQIYELLFFIAPTSLISFFVVLKLKEKGKKGAKSKISPAIAYTKIFSETKNFNNGLKIVAMISFVSGILSSVIYYFVPISYYISGSSLVSAASLALVYTIPYLLGNYLGKIADTKKEKTYLFGTSILVLLLGLLIFSSNYFVLIGVMFFSSAIFELIYLTNKGMITRIAERAHVGEVDGSLNGIAALGAVIGPVVFGLLFDVLGFAKAYMFMILIVILALIVLIKERKSLKN